MTKSLDERMQEVGGECLGVHIALLATKAQLGEKTVSEFLDKVDEKNSRLWDRFRAYQKTASPECSFVDFVLSVVGPETS